MFLKDIHRLSPDSLMSGTAYYKKLSQVDLLCVLPVYCICNRIGCLVKKQGLVRTCKPILHPLPKLQNCH